MTQDESGMIFITQRPQLPRISVANKVHQNKMLCLGLFHQHKSFFMQKITPFLWFNDNAEEAVNFYCFVFKEAKAGEMVRTGPEGKVLTAPFELFGQKFTALNGGPHFTFTEAVSFVVHCDDQEEVDYYWNKLTEGGKPSRCGWLKDKFGLSWQIVPKALPKLLGDKDPARSGRVMQTLMQMDKLDIAKLEDAYAGRETTAA